MNLLENLTISQIIEQIVLVAFTGTKILQKDLKGFNIRHIDSYHRDILLKITKRSLKKHLKERSQSDIIIKPLQFITAIEEYIRKNQEYELSTIQDDGLVKILDEFKLLRGIDNM